MGEAGRGGGNGEGGGGLGEIRGEGLFDRVETFDQGSGQGDQAVSFPGGEDSAPENFDEGALKLLFEGPDLLPNRGFGESEFAGGDGKAPGSGDGDEGPELLEAQFLEVMAVVGHELFVGGKR